MLNLHLHDTTRNENVKVFFFLKKKQQLESRFQNMAMNVDKRRRVIWIRRSHEENNNFKGVSGRVFVFIFEYFSKVFLI